MKLLGLDQIKRIEEKIIKNIRNLFKLNKENESIKDRKKSP